MYAKVKFPRDNKCVILPEIWFPSLLSVYITDWSKAKQMTFTTWYAASITLVITTLWAAFHASQPFTFKKSFMSYVISSAQGEVNKWKRAGTSEAHGCKQMSICQSPHFTTKGGKNETSLFVKEPFYCSGVTVWILLSHVLNGVRLWAQ